MMNGSFSMPNCLHTRCIFKSKNSFNYPIQSVPNSYHHNYTGFFFLLLPSDDRLDSVGIDPADEGRDASEHVGHAETARDTPRDNTVEGTALHQRAAGVTHAHALAGRAQRTDGRVEDAASVGCGVTVAAVSQRDDLGVQELEMVRDTDVGLLV